MLQNLPKQKKNFCSTDKNYVVLIYCVVNIIQLRDLYCHT